MCSFSWWSFFLYNKIKSKSILVPLLSGKAVLGAKHSSCVSIYVKRILGELLKCELHVLSSTSSGCPHSLFVEYHKKSNTLHTNTGIHMKLNCGAGLPGKNNSVV